MCRNIRVLHNFEPAATPEEIEAAALQYVRKISGSTKPSKANEAAFARAVEEVTAASRRLLDSLVTTAPPRDREVEAAKARARAAPPASRSSARARCDLSGAILRLSGLIIGLLARFAVPGKDPLGSGRRSCSGSPVRSSAVSPPPRSA